MSHSPTVVHLTFIPIYMNRFILWCLLLLACSSAAQAQTMKDKNYKPYWDKVSKALSANKTQDAIVLLDQLATNANKDKMYSDYIAAIASRQKLQQEVTELWYDAFIAELDSIGQTLESPYKEIIYNLIAKHYDEASEDSRYQDDSTDDWDENTNPRDAAREVIHNNGEKLATQYYLKALSNADVLASYEAKMFAPLLTNGATAKPSEWEKQVKPSLYYVMLSSALDFFDDAFYGNVRENPFYLGEHPEAYSDLPEFVQIDWQTTDTASAMLQRLKLYQQALSVKKLSAEEKSYLDSKRIEFIHEQISDNVRHIQALANAVDIHKQSKIVDYLVYKRALAIHNLVNEKAQKKLGITKPNTTALNICKDIVARNTCSFAVSAAKSLIREIELPQLEAKTEDKLLPNQPALMTIAYVNIQAVAVEVYPYSGSEYMNYATAVKYLQKTKPIYTKDYTLPPNDDYTFFETEMMLPALPLGKYHLVIRNKNKADAFYLSLLQVTNLDLHISTGDSAKVQVVDRTTGKGIEGASIFLLKNEWNNTTRKNNEILVEQISSKANAFVKLPNKEYSSVRVTYNKDVLDHSYYRGGSYYQNYNGGEQSTFLAEVYTDRAIYRPGQTIKYKAIIVDKDNKAALGQTITISLVNANEEIVSTVEKRTNEFGSTSGEFELPSSGLNGMYDLSVKVDDVEIGSAAVRVEEYKRPKFEVSYEPSNKDYKLDEEVTVTGIAMGYNGAPIANAKVRYNVDREAEVLRWCFPDFEGERRVITEGTTVTDANGKFTIKYMASGTSELNKKRAIYTFITSATVVDINGETHEASNDLRLSKQPFSLALNIGDELDLSSNSESFEIAATTPNGKQVEQQVFLRIQKLKQQKAFTVNRLWEPTEHSFISEQEWQQFFPLADRYSDDDDKELVETELVFGTPIAANKPFKPSQYIKTTGKYRLYTWVVVDGDTIADQAVVQISDSEKEPLEPKEVHVLKSDSKTLVAGAAPKLKVYSRFADVSMSLSAVAYQQTFWQVYQLKQGWNMIDLPMLNEARSNLVVSTAISYANRHYTQDFHFDAPEPVQDINLKLVSFRDKIVPGSEQEITIQLTEPTIGDKAFELLATMYDASLDDFVRHFWNGIPEKSYSIYGRDKFSAASTFANELQLLSKTDEGRIYTSYGNYLEDTGLHTYCWSSNQLPHMLRSMNDKQLRGRMAMKAGWNFSESSIGGFAVASDSALPPPPPTLTGGTYAYTASVGNAVVAKVKFAPPVIAKDEEVKQSAAKVTIRKNLQETAFFLPHLTSSDGIYNLKFTAPEALTKWRMMAFAHNAEGKHAKIEASTTTQKDIMVVPNLPRFVYNNDKVSLLVKINNLSKTEQSGTASIQILNAATEQDITAQFVKSASQSFAIAAASSSEFAFDINVPDNFSDPIIVRTIAVAKEHSDGEQNMLPILSNKIQVTESATALLKPGEEKPLDIPALQKLSNKQQPILLQLQSTSNPTWHAVQALPYLHNYALECTEQLTNKLYAFAVAKKLGELNPALLEASQTWLKDSNALRSQLESNPELRQIMLQETPWVSEAKDENAQLASIGKLFKEANQEQSYNTLISKIVARQKSNGGYAWWPDMNDNEYITLSILQSFAQLKQMAALPQQEELQTSIAKAIAYCDSKELARYEQEKKNAKQYGTYYTPINYLYIRYVFADITPTKATQTAIDARMKTLAKDWTKLSIADQATYAYILYTSNKEANAKQVTDAILQNAVRTKARGMYWKNSSSYFRWFTNDVDDHAHTLAMLQNCGVKQAELDELCIWLLLNKQNNYWSNTAATANAIHALVTSGASLTDGSTQNIAFNVGGKQINSNSYKQDKGTGNVRVQFAGNNIDKKMSNIMASNSNATPAWVNASYQFLSPIDELQASETKNAISVRKALFVVSNSNTGEVLTPVTNNLKLGDKVRIQITISTNRDMQFVHVKDLRAACFEPIDVLSETVYANNLAYYQVTKDASTNFFIDNLSRGTYTISYDVFVNSTGNYNNGNASIQCMYSPEFTAYGAGGTIEISGK
ncbi:MAG: hypothetical protein RL660_2422 [Bacteroidota bacterium]